jgi:hypothetical protein
VIFQVYFGTKAMVHLVETKVQILNFDHSLGYGDAVRKLFMMLDIKPQLPVKLHDHRDK